uniref:Uncharacterized protein n=1 Tax=Lepeophtheirus salmonis TaxID=72036 RepID=A0A0K2U5M8_LEPSM
MMFKFNKVVAWIVYFFIFFSCTKGQPINSEQENQDHQRTAQQCVYLAELKLTQRIKNNTVDIVHAMCTSFNDKVICMNTYYSKCFNPRVAQQSTNQYIGNQLKTILNHSNILDVQKFLHCSVFQSYFQDSNCTNEDFFQSQMQQAENCIKSKTQELSPKTIVAVALSGTLVVQYLVNIVCDIVVSISTGCANPCHSQQFLDDNIRNLFLQLETLAQVQDPSFTLNTCLSVDG